MQEDRKQPNKTTDKEHRVLGDHQRLKIRILPVGTLCVCISIRIHPIDVETYQAIDRVQLHHENLIPILYKLLIDFLVDEG